MTTKRNTKILYAISEEYPTHRADIRALFGKYLPRHNVFSDIISGTTDAPDITESWGGGKLLLCKLPNSNLAKRLYFFLHVIRILITYDKRQYDAVQIRDMPITAAFAVIVSKLRGFSFLYWMSYPIPEGQIDLARRRKLSSGFVKFLYPYVSGHIGKFLLYKFVLSNSQHIFVQSDVMKKEMIDRGYPEEKLTPVPMGVDIENVDGHAVPASNNQILSGRKVLIYLGILERARNLSTLLHMLKIVLLQHPDTILVLAGDTPDVTHRNELLQEAKNMGLEQSVYWTGWLSIDEAWSYLKAADIALSPYPRGHLLDSASPTKVAEYMAFGKPIVANDQPDQNFLLSESKAGIAVEYTSEKFAEAVIYLLENDNVRKSMSERGPAWVRLNRSYASIAPVVASVYQKVIQ